MAKTFKQFQQDIQEIDQNLGGPLKFAQGISWGARAISGALSRFAAGAAGSSSARPTTPPKKIPKWKGPGGDPSGSGIGQAQQLSK